MPQPHDPSSQGFVQPLGVFIDTILVCTATALLILLSGTLDPASGITGTQLTQAALATHIDFFGGTFVVSYAENALTYLGLANKPGVAILRGAVVLMVVWGAVQTVATVVDAADASMGLMATINLIAIVLLSGTVAKLTKDYFAQRRAGQEPTFHRDDYPELTGEIDNEIWRR